MQQIYLFIWIILSFVLMVKLRLVFADLLAIFSMLLTRSLKLSKIIYSFIFFPGVLLHEMSHLLIALLVGVRTGRVSIFPEQIGSELKLGSVQVAKTDVIRKSLIGSAPLIIGLTSILAILQYRFSIFTLSADFLVIFQKITSINGIIDALWLYLVFTISNTMFLSKTDQRGFIPAGIILGSVAVFLVVGTNWDFREIIFSQICHQALLTLSIAFTLVSFVNLIFTIPLATSVYLLKKLRWKKEPKS